MDEDVHQLCVKAQILKGLTTDFSFYASCFFVFANQMCYRKFGCSWYTVKAAKRGLQQKEKVREIGGKVTTISSFCILGSAVRRRTTLHSACICELLCVNCCVVQGMKLFITAPTGWTFGPSERRLPATIPPPQLNDVGLGGMVFAGLGTYCERREDHHR